MKITIFGGPPVSTPVPDQLCVKLEINEYSKRVQVIAVNSVTGVKLDGGVLIEFYNDGTFARAPSIRAPGTGVQLDSGGRMVERESSV